MKTKIEKDLGMCDQKEREFMEELYRKYERLMYATVRRYMGIRSWHGILVASRTVSE